MNNENDSRNISLDETKLSQSVPETEKNELNSIIEDYEKINVLYPEETQE
jgi:hypothetical protein